MRRQRQTQASSISGSGISSSRTILLVALAALSIPARLASGAAQPASTAVNSALRQLFPTAEKASDLIVRLGPEDIRAARARNGNVAARESLAVTIASAAGSALGYVVVDDVKGKDMPITYMVAVDTALRVLDLQILAYRESYGGEVRNAVWRRQFVGRSPDEPLRHGREIRNITGATISARAVTEGVRDLLALLAVTRRRLVPQEAP